MPSRSEHSGPTKVMPPRPSLKMPLQAPNRTDRSGKSEFACFRARRMPALRLKSPTVVLVDGGPGRRSVERGFLKRARLTKPRNDPTCRSTQHTRIYNDSQRKRPMHAPQRSCLLQCRLCHRSGFLHHTQHIFADNKLDPIQGRFDQHGALSVNMSGGFDQTLDGLGKCLG